VDGDNLERVKSSLRLGLIPLGADAGAMDRVSAFAAGFGSAVGAPIELHKAADYRALVAAFEQGLVDCAWLPPLTAARVMRGAIAVPAAIAVRNGTTSYMTGLLSLKSSGIASAAQLNGVRAAWVDRESASGYVLIRAALKAKGVSLVDAFREELFVRSHAEVARALHEKRADVGATCFNFTDRGIEIARSGYDDLANDAVNVVAHAGPIPSDIFALHRSVAINMLPKVQSVLVDGHRAAAHDAACGLMHSDGFARPNAAHVRMIESLFTILDAAPSRR
jgi:phosphonate transport system substrate-binding protein